MKKSFRLPRTGATLGVKVLPGVFKLTPITPDGGSVDEGAWAVLNSVPNHDNDAKAGWNYLAASSASASIASKKLNPLYDADTNPGVDQYIPVNFLTAQEAADAYEDEEYRVTVS